MIAALFVDGEQSALNRADAGRGNIAVLGGELPGIVADVLHHRPQVFQIEKQQAFVVRYFEHQHQHAALRIVEVKQARQQQRPHFGHGGANRMTERAEYVPENRRAAGEGEIAERKFVDALLELGIHGPGLRQAGEIAFDIGHEHRHADRAQRLGHGLQGHSLARAGGPGDQSVTIGESGQQAEFVR